jgi:hypothetical protein
VTSEQFVAYHRAQALEYLANTGKKNALTYEASLEILKDTVFDDDCSWAGAVTFVSLAFGVPADEVVKAFEEA